MEHTLSLRAFAGWLFGGIVFIIGMLNLLLIHAVPGNFFLLLSFIYFPPVTVYLRERFACTIPVVVKIILGVAIIWFTVGISDLGELIDNM